MKRLLFFTNGCEQRMLDMEYFKHLATINGDKVVSDTAEADTVLYVSCCVSRFSCETAIREITSYCDKGIPVVIYGCLPGIESEWLDSLGLTYYTVQQRECLVTDMNWTFSVPYPILNAQDNPYLSLVGKSPRMQFDYAKLGKKLVICNGCLNQCTYCVIRFATGRLKSKPISEIVKEWRETVQPGDHVMLMGGDTGAYGMDIGTDLPQLLEALQAENIAADIFLHDLNIRWMRNTLEEFCHVIGSQSLVRGLTLPIQSGSDEILASMKRHYTAVDIQTCFYQIHEADPELMMGTHVIVGYPGETEAHFDETVKLLKQLPLDFISCFPYSEHEKADSTALKPKVSPQQICERIDRLTAIFGDNLKAYT